jgi:hypothetical protein
LRKFRFRRLRSHKIAYIESVIYVNKVLYLLPGVIGKVGKVEGAEGCTFSKKNDQYGVINNSLKVELFVLVSTRGQLKPDKEEVDPIKWL